jgi:hypothetical protein
MARREQQTTRHEFLGNASPATGTLTLEGLVPSTSLAGEKTEHKFGAQLIGTVGQSPAQMGVRIVSKRRGNIPARQVNAQHARAPCSSYPATFFFKS